MLSQRYLIYFIQEQKQFLQNLLFLRAVCPITQMQTWYAPLDLLV